MATRSLASLVALALALLGCGARSPLAEPPRDASVDTPQDTPRDTPRGQPCGCPGTASFRLCALPLMCCPVTRNCEEVDPACPINVVKEKQGPLSGRPASALVLSQSQTGQCAAVALVGPKA